MTQELTVRQTDVGIFLPPDIVLENARTAAKALISVVSQKKKPVIMNGEQYLEYEDWQTCGQFYGYTVRTHHAEPVEVDGVKGARAEADLVDVRTGEVIGGAEAYCMRDEEHWNTRPKYEWQGEGGNRQRVKVGDEVVPWFQLASMAQTRAGAKAFRNRLAWVVVLAGYRATPAEEMTEGTISEAVKGRRTVDKPQHWCSLHNTEFFKKGNMKGYAHKLPDGTWCNEEKTKDPIRDAAKVKVGVESKHETAPEPLESTESPTTEETNANGYIDLAVLEDNLNELRQKHVDWADEKNLLSYMKKIYKKEGASVLEVAAQLDKGSAAHFMNQIQNTIEMA